MNKITKTMLLLVAATTGMVSLVSCDDDNLPAADGLFRPVINESDNITHGLTSDNVPYIILKWDNYTTANQYIVKIEAQDGSDTREITTDTVTYRFDNLQYDKEYNISLQSANTQTGLTSKPFTLTTTTLDYPTAMSTPSTLDLIDTQARIKWAEGTSYTELKVFEDNSDELVCDTTLTDAINQAGELIIKGLTPKTSYRVEAYADGAYRGKKRFATVAPESYEGAVYDLRDLDDSEGAKYITTDQIAIDVAAHPDEDITYVLTGGLEYRISGGTKIPATAKKVKFVTGLTLAGNAIFRQTGGWAINAGEDVEALEFEKIDIISDKAQAGGGYEIETNTDKGFGGRQVFNINGVKATLKNLTFKNCTMTGFRAVVRGQGDGDNITNILLEDCVINGIGDQGVFTTTNKDEDWQSITMKNCTVTNIVMLCDLRKTTNTLKFTIENCTFCYAPIETTANANTPLFRLGSGNVDLTVKNTLFGPSMATENSGGGSLMTYTAGVAGSIHVAGTPANLDVQDSYKTNFIWTDRNTTGEGDPLINPLDGLKDLPLSETELWKTPSKGVFNIIGSAPGVDFSQLGDNRWR